MAGRRARLSVLLADKSALDWARRDARARAAFLSLRTSHVIAASHMTALEICYSARNQADLEALLAGQRALEWLPVSEAAHGGLPAPADLFGDGAAGAERFIYRDFDGSLSGRLR